LQSAETETEDESVAVATARRPTEKEEEYIILFLYSQRYCCGGVCGSRERNDGQIRVRRGAR
jgi:hypothetical protein